MDFKNNVILSKKLCAGAPTTDDLRSLLAVPGKMAAFIEFAVRNQVRPPLIKGLIDCDLFRQLSANDANLLQSYSASQTRRHSRLCAILKEIDSVLRPQGIEYLVLKGPAYAERLYGDIDGRHFDDIDILVRRRDRIPAEAQLVEIGFTPTEEWRPWDSMLRHFEHAVTLSKDGYKIDLHWELRNRPAYRINEMNLWTARRELEVAGVRVSVLSHDYELTAAGLEIAHDLERNACTVKTVMDLYLLIRNAEGNIDWKRFFTDRRRENVASVLVNVFGLSLILLSSSNEFPSLSSYLKPLKSNFSFTDETRIAALFDRSVEDGQNSAWFREIYPGNRAIYWIWLGMAFLCSRKSPRFLNRAQRTIAAGR